eukprot:TRINITY_DN2943_c0_g1_i18.p1 TRINITY_DN2943_c0_g1~~TRINITY_DN2943_c0_g1_i18.p1  ORF type:complete len:155 (-),score=43.18 TRINITY_DN2943_c0_g1_i18:348-812(-)
MYNYATREIERELIPVLRMSGMRFYAYNPLAGGILTGLLNFDSNPNSGRFSGLTEWGNKYRDRYWYKPLFDTQEKLKKLATTQNTTNTAFALNWLVHHSQLIPGDGIIVGGSSLNHIRENLKILQNSFVLDEVVVEVLDECWDEMRGICPSYFR